MVLAVATETKLVPDACAVVDAEAKGNDACFREGRVARRAASTRFKPRVEERSRSGNARSRIRDINNFISFSGFDKGPERFPSNLRPLFFTLDVKKRMVDRIG